MSRNRYFEDEVIENHFNKFMLGRLIAYAKDYKKTYIKVVALLIGTSLLSLIPTGINMVIINDVLPKDSAVPDNAIAMAAILLSVWFTLSIGSVIANYAVNVAANSLGNIIICNIRKDLFAKLMELSFNYYDSRPMGKILVRVTNYTNEVADFFINYMTRIVSNLFIAMMAIICICVLDIRIAAVAIAVSIPLALLMWFLSKSLHGRMVYERNKQSNRTAFVVENINGLEVIKAFNREKINSEIFMELSAKYKKEYMRATRVRELFFPLAHGIVSGVCTIVIYVTALFIITKDWGSALSLGTIVTIATYMQRFSGAVNVICQRLQTIGNITSNVERIFEVLDTEAEIKEADNGVSLCNVKGKVEFENVDFAYIKDNNVLENINLTVEPGQMIALVGPTGAGKTTIVSLISRFYDVTGGAVKIDGTDVRDISFKSLRDNVGVMMQDTFLFKGEIIDNIRFSRPDATDEECIEAAKTVFAHDFIIKKPEGYHTVISSQGTELSGGEKQLISFARLVLSNPKIIILDEATSNIDTETEKLIQKMFKTVLKGRTSFVIAHRLSTIKNADRILYIDEKSILEDGSREELLNKKGKYYQLEM
ncbi:MAG: ABC transporter ATP-binding protein [Lachnospiraceae bacterium]